MYRRVTVTNVVLAVLLKCYYNLNLGLDSPSVHRSVGYNNDRLTAFDPGQPG